MSTNGTFLFMKNVPEMDMQKPSELIRLQKDMVITVINYEIHVEEVHEQPCTDAHFFHFEQKHRETHEESKVETISAHTPKHEAPIEEHAEDTAPVESVRKNPS